MKRVFWLLIIIVVLLSIMVLYGFAEEKAMKLVIGEKNIDCDAPPVIYEDEMLVPLRIVFENFNFSVEWNNKEKSVMATREEIEIEVRIGQGYASINGKKIKIETPAKLIGNRTFVSTETIDKLIGEKVEWDKNKGRVLISNETLRSESNQEITIIFPDFQSGTDFPATQNYYYEFLKNITEEYEKEKGIKVNIKRLSGEYYNDYIKMRHSELDLEEGPELVFIDVWDSCVDLIKSGKVANINGRIENIYKLNSGLRDDYFVPVSIYNGNLTLNKEKIKSLGLVMPNYDWSRNDYLKIRDKWLENEEIRFNQDEYWNLIKTTWDDVNIVNDETDKIDLNNQIIKDYVKRIREDIHSKYILYDNYTCENYSNMFSDFRSDEFREGIEVFKEELEKHFVMTPYEYRKNLLNPLDSNSIIIDESVEVLPDVVEYGKVHAWGFLVNKNGRNNELAIEFLNKLLSDEIQLEMYILGSNSSGMAPVSKDIEDEIERINVDNDISNKAIDTRKFILNEIEKENYKLVNVYADENEFKKIKFVKGIIKIIFADKPCTDEKIGELLLELEEELNNLN